MALGHPPSATSGSVHYPRPSVLEKKMNEYAGHHDEATPVGLTKDGRILTEKEFNKKNSWTGYLSFGRLSLGAITDQSTGETFNDCLTNMHNAIEHNHLKGSLLQRTVKRCNVSEKPTISQIRVVSQTLRSLPEYKECSSSAVKLTAGQLTEFSYFLFDYADTAGKFSISSREQARKLAIEMYCLSPEDVTHLCKLIEGTIDITAETHSLMHKLIQSCLKARKTVPETTLQVGDDNIAPRPDSTKKCSFKDQTITTVFSTLSLPQGIKNPEMTTDDWDLLEYQLEIDPQKVAKELSDNLERAKSAQAAQNEEPQSALRTSLSSSTPPPETCFDSGHLPNNVGTVFASTYGTSVVGGMDPYMQDACASGMLYCSVGGQWIPVKFTAVLDGHGKDDNVSKICAAQLSDRLKVRLEEFNEGKLTKVGVVAALNAAIVDIDRTQRFPYSGTTLNLTAEIGDHLWIANVGDSRAILVNLDGSCMQLSEDAKLQPEDVGSESDQQKAKESRFNTMVHERGGRVYSQRNLNDDRYLSVRAAGPNELKGLPMATATGDHTHNGVLSGRPTVTAIPLTEISPGSMVLQMSDGVTDDFSTDHIGQLVHSCMAKGQKTVVEKVRDCAFHLHPEDKGNIDNIMVTAYPIPH